MFHPVNDGMAAFTTALATHHAPNLAQPHRLCDSGATLYSARSTVLKSLPQGVRLGLTPYPRVRRRATLKQLPTTATPCAPTLTGRAPSRCSAKPSARTSAAPPSGIQTARPSSLGR